MGQGHNESESTTYEEVALSVAGLIRDRLCDSSDDLIEVLGGDHGDQVLHLVMARHYDRRQCRAVAFDRPNDPSVPNNDDIEDDPVLWVLSDLAEQLGAVLDPHRAETLARVLTERLHDPEFQSYLSSWKAMTTL